MLRGRTGAEAVEQVLRIAHELHQEPAFYLLTSRIVAQTTGRTEFKWFWLANPTRLVFDLTQTGAGLADGTLPVGGGLVQAVRWAAKPGQVFRVVLDLSRAAAFRSFWLDSPPRLVIDVDRLEVTLYDHERSRLAVLPFDEYLGCAVAAEMPTSFQPEALKAQAVVARTYALRRLRVFAGTGCAKHPGADICSDPAHCQGYLSPERLRADWKEDYEHNWAKVSAAVDTTRQLYLGFGFGLAETVYHSSCGGHTASASEVWGTALPYLGGVPCEYCEISPDYRSTRRVSLADASQRLGLEFLGVRRRSPSGRAVEVAAAGTTLDGADLRQRLGLDSALVEDVTGEFAVTTRGAGHGVGLCQWGAEGQARLGRSLREILFYYYPGTALAGAAFGPDAGLLATPPGPGPVPEPTPGPAPDPPSPSPAPLPLPVVVLDPGHGGSDPGATGPGGLAEKDANLAVTLAAAEALAGKVSLRLTRGDDRAVTLRARTDLAAAAGAALFVSIHGNGWTDPKTGGTETYYYPVSRLGNTLATFLQARLVAAIRRRNRGVKEANFFVLRETNCPAALCETLFLTNPEEEALLGDRAFQQKVGEAIAAGILDYLAKLR